MNQALDPAILADLVHDTVAQGKKPYLTVISGSMAPLLRRTDQVQTEAVDPAALTAGDIIVIAGVEAFMTHRYYGTLYIDDQPYLVTKGDRPVTFDSPWPLSRLVGRVIARRRNNRRLDLTTGRGRWLNQQLFRLTQLERYLLTRHQPNHANLAFAQAGYIDFPHYDRDRRWYHALYRRLIGAAMTGLVTAVTRLTQE